MSPQATNSLIKIQKKLKLIKKLEKRDTWWGKIMFKVKYSQELIKIFISILISSFKQNLNSFSFLEPQMQKLEKIILC